MTDFNTKNGAISRDTLSSAVALAEKAFSNAREHGAFAAANAYFVWLHSCSSIANEDHTLWFNDEYAKRSAAITAHNEQLDRKKNRIKAEEAKTVKGLKEKLRAANDPDSKKAFENKIESVRKEAADQRRGLTAERKLSLESREDANDFTTIVKFVLKADNPKQSASVSRYAKVLTWIQDKCGLHAELTVEAIAEVVLEAGGIEAVYDLQKGAEDAATTTDADEKQPAVAAEADVPVAAIAEHFREMVQAATPLASINEEGAGELATHANEGELMLLVVRNSAGRMNIISELKVDMEELLDLCVKHNDQRLLTSDAASEFIWAALAAGDLVEEGKRNGDGQTAVRTLSIVADGTNTKLVVSPLHASVGVVVHAVPNTRVDLGMPAGHSFLYHEHLEPLRQRLANPVARKMMTIHATATRREVGENLLASDYAWVSTQKPLLTAAGGKASLAHAWLPMSPHEASPLDIDGFTPAGKFSVQRDDLVSLFDDSFKAWKDDKATRVEVKPTALVKVVYGKATLTLSTTNNKYELPCKGSNSLNISQHCRARLLANVVSLLLDLHVENVTLWPDPRGALRVGFTTDYGSYSIYLPMPDEKGVLATARFAPMNVFSDPEDIAA